MSHRRAFLGSVIGGATGAAVAATGTAASARVLGANERIRFGLIGVGGRGKEIFRAALRCPDVEAVAVADIYTRRLEEAKAIVPGIATFKDHRALLDDKSIDAVLIATPQHLHALHFVAAIQAGKDVYQEKTMAFNPGTRPPHEERAGGIGTSGSDRHADEQRRGHPECPRAGQGRRLGHRHAAPDAPLSQRAVRRLAP